MVVFAVQDVFRPGVVVRKILVVRCQLLEFRRVVDVEHLPLLVRQLEGERHIQVEHVPLVLLFEQHAVEVMEFPVARLRRERHDALFFLRNRFQIRGIRFRAVDGRQVVLFAQVFAVQDQLLDGFSAVLRHHVQLAVDLRLVPAHLGHVLPRLRHVLGQHIVRELEEAALQRLIVVARPVGRVDQVEVLVGGQLQRILLCPVGPVEEFAFDRRVNLLFELLVELGEHRIVVDRLRSDEDHLELHFFGRVDGAFGRRGSAAARGRG